MQELYELLTTSDPCESGVRNRLFYGFFCGVVASILLYFWYLGRRSISSAKGEGGALVFLALAYLLYFVMSLASVPEPQLNPLLVLSTLANMCLLLALPFFVEDDSGLDRLVRGGTWRNGVYAMSATLLVVFSWGQQEGGDWRLLVDQLVSIFTYGLLAFFVGRYFWTHGLRFLTAVSTFFFLVTIVLLINPEQMLEGGKFEHPNMSIFVPALALSTILLAYSFNWISDLQFREVSGIWLSRRGATHEGASTGDEEEVDKSWETLLAEDQLEAVVEGLILHKRSRNESLELIINVASRNTRNNNQRLKELVSKDEYQVERNKIAQALLHLVQAED